MSTCTQGSNLQDCALAQDCALDPQMWLRMVYCPAIHSLDRLVHLRPLVLDSLLWWMHPENICQGVHFVQPLPTKAVTTNASLIGWGSPGVTESTGTVFGAGGLIPYQLAVALGCMSSFSAPYQRLSFTCLLTIPPKCILCAQTRGSTD